MRNIGRSSPIKATLNIALVTDTAMGVGVERTTIFTSEEAPIKQALEKSSSIKWHVRNKSKSGQGSVLGQHCFSIINLKFLFR